MGKWNDGRFEKWENGMLEYWNVGEKALILKPTIPLLQYSIIPLLGVYGFERGLEQHLKQN